MCGHAHAHALNQKHPDTLLPWRTEVTEADVVVVAVVDAAVVTKMAEEADAAAVIKMAEEVGVAADIKNIRHHYCIG